MTVLHEMHLADPVDVDRRHRNAAATGGRDPLPASAYSGRGRPEVPIELAALASHCPDDRVEPDRLDAEVTFAAPSERLHDLLERQHRGHVVRLEPQPSSDLRQSAATALPREIRLCVLLWQSSVHHGLTTVVRRAAGGPIIGSDKTPTGIPCPGYAAHVTQVGAPRRPDARTGEHLGALRAGRIRDADCGGARPVRRLPGRTGVAVGVGACRE